MNTQQMPQRFLPFMGVLLLAACGSDTTAPDGGRPAVSVSVVPTTASLLTSGSQDFTATVTNDPTNRGVAWSITGCSGGPAVCGSLSNVTNTTATYAAPTTVPPGALGVTATSVSDNSKSVMARVTITAVAAAGQIAFYSPSDNGGVGDIYVMNADGSGQVNLTNNPAEDYPAGWSPDGSKILFETNRDGNYEIYVMNADGSGQVNLTNNPASDADPAWSPDGSKIAFNSSRDGNVEVYVLNADGSGLRNLTNNPAGDLRPAWSPDGSKIAFLRNLDIYVMNADGSGQVNLTNNPATDDQPAWSPDGSKIAFTRSPDGASFSIYVMQVDGSSITRLTTTTQDDGAAWSPEGTKIAFSSFSGGIYGQWQIYVMNADGSGVTQLTSTSTRSNRDPVWRPR